MTPPIADSLYLQLEQILASRIDPQRIITQEAKRLAYGTDASFYRLIPKIVLRLKSLDEVIFAIQSCGQLGIHFTFRGRHQLIGSSRFRLGTDHLNRRLARA